tara:strand:+ start:3693 stop:4034 length:342 start_codon:yes stop_codon:yes gene_type:complete
MHIGNNHRKGHLEGHTPLVRSTNAYAQGGNNDSMRQWVMHKMNMEPQERQRIIDLENKVNRLERIIDDISSNKKIVSKILREELKSNRFKRAVDAIVVKRLKTSFRFGRGEEE